MTSTLIAPLTGNRFGLIAAGGGGRAQLGLVRMLLLLCRCVNRGEDVRTGVGGETHVDIEGRPISS